MKIVAFAVCTALALNVFAQDGAHKEVRAVLKRSEIKVGVDREKMRYVFIGSCEIKVTDPANDSKFHQKRSNCAKIAELRAKRDLMKARSVKVTLADSTESMSDGDRSIILTKSLCKFIAEDQHTGSTVLCSAESWDDQTGQYQVAVAVAWSEKLEADGGRLQVPISDPSFADEDPEWERWVKSVNIESVFGSRQFKDSRGFRRYVGIGSADIDGKKGKALKDAYTVAKLTAKEQLAFALYSESESRDVAKTILAQIQMGDVEETDAWERFESEVIRRCKGKILRADMVYDSDELKNPITGRPMFVAVYGVKR